MNFSKSSYIIFFITIREDFIQLYIIWKTTMSTKNWYRNITLRYRLFCSGKRILLRPETYETSCTHKGDQLAVSINTQISSSNENIVIFSIDSYDYNFIKNE